MRAISSGLNVEDWFFLQARLLWCYSGLVAPRSRQEDAKGRHLCAWYLQAGKVELRVVGRVWKAREGEWLFAGPHPRRQVFSEDARIVSINFKLEWPSGDSLLDQILVLPAKMHPELLRSAMPLARFIRKQFGLVRIDLQREPAGPEIFFELQRLFSAWVANYVQAFRSAGGILARMEGLDKRVLTALKLLDRHAWSVSFREPELAKQVGVSAGYLDRLFVQQLGETPRAYLQKRRMESALAQLSEPSTPIKKIAYDLGFSSPAHFCHWFKKATEKSPREFRDSV